MSICLRVIYFNKTLNILILIYDYELRQYELKIESLFLRKFSKIP